MKETKPGVNLPLILALFVVAVVAALAACVVIRFRYQKREKRIQEAHTAQVDELEKELLRSRAELLTKTSPGQSSIIQLPPFSNN